MDREDWTKISFDKKYVRGTVKKNKDDTLHISGEVKHKGQNKYLTYWAADPAQILQSFSGSLLPFATKQMAFSNKTNIGQVKINGGRFSFKITMPNSFYKGLGTNYVPPIVNMRLCETVEDVNDYDSVQVSNGNPYKYLNHPAITATGANIKKQYKPSGPLFYTNTRFPPRGQEEILRSSGYPKYNKMPSNFWGDKPSL